MGGFVFGLNGRHVLFKSFDQVIHESFRVVAEALVKRQSLVKFLNQACSRDI